VADSQTPIQSLAAALAAEFPPTDPRSLGRYLEDIVDWNDRIGLVSKRSVLPSLERLVLQSGGLLGFLRDRTVISPSGNHTVIDIGTGAGFPGLVWALMQPSLRVTLLERRQKKVTFLQRMTVVLRLANVDVAEGDATELGTYERFSGNFDVATSFAVAPPASIAHIVEPFVKPGGCYATLRPRDESAQPDRIGRSLVLESATDHDSGQFCIYRQSSSRPI
jgi:16S rRNA (guanine527-N7)-methyltransferase